MRIVGGHAATLVLVAAMTLTGCSGGGTTDDTSGSPVSPREDTTTAAPLLEAVDLVDPARTVGIDFTSDRQSAERLGLLPDSGSSWADLAAQYDASLADVPDTDHAAVGLLAEEVTTMADGGAAFSQLDVRWTMTATTGVADDDRHQVRVIRLVDTLPMEEVVADLDDAGFVASDGEGGWSTHHLPGQLSDHVDISEGSQVEGRFPQDFFPDVHVNQELHLVALGDLAALRTAGSDASFEDEVGNLLPPDPEAVEYFLVTAGAFANCYAPVDKATNYRSSPRAIRSWMQKYGTAALGRPGVTTLWGVPGEDLVHRSYFKDEEAARAALGGRTRTYQGVALTDEVALGVLMPRDGNDSPYELGWTMSRSGNVIQVLHNRTAPDDAVYIYRLRGLGFDACTP